MCGEGAAGGRGAGGATYVSAEVEALANERCAEPAELQAGEAVYLTWLVHYALIGVVGDLLGVF